jgi:hypothetical protein
MEFPCLRIGEQTRLHLGIFHDSRRFHQPSLAAECGSRGPRELRGAPPWSCRSVCGSGPFRQSLRQVESVMPQKSVARAEDGAIDKMANQAEKHAAGCN